MYSIVVVVWAGKAGHEMNTIATPSHDLRELGHDLRHAVPVPERGLAVHWWRDEEASPRRSKRSRVDCLKNILEDRDDAMGHHTSLGRARQEIRDARKHAHCCFGSNRLQGLREGRHLRAGDHLAAGHQGAVAAVRRIHMTPDVRVPDQGEAAGQRHRANHQVNKKTECSTWIKSFICMHYLIT